MNIYAQFEIGRIRLKAELTTLSLEAHSRMQQLSVEQIEQLRDKLFFAVQDATLMISENTKSPIA